MGGLVLPLEEALDAVADSQNDRRFPRQRIRHHVSSKFVKQAKVANGR